MPSDTRPLRLQIILRDALGLSRRTCDEAIQNGRVAVNGIVASPGSKADPATDTITFDGQPIAAKPVQPTIIMLHKAAGYVTTRSDPQGRPTVFDLLPPTMRRLFPVGRLDRDTEGLLLLTDDGNLANLLTHPRFEVEKEYVAQLDRPLLPADRAKITRGIHGPLIDAAPAQVLSADPDATVRLVLREGQKREVRLMFRSLGYNVRRLRRERVANLRLGSLARGTFRALEPSEIRSLQAVAHPRQRR